MEEEEIAALRKSLGREPGESDIYKAAADKYSRGLLKETIALLRSLKHKTPSPDVAHLLAHALFRVGDSDKKSLVSLLAISVTKHQSDWQLIVETLCG
eukprot:tig00001206_g7506.t1